MLVGWLVAGALSSAIVTLFLWLYRYVLVKCAVVRLVVCRMNSETEESLLLFTDWIIDLRAREIVYMYGCCCVSFGRLPIPDRYAESTFLLLFLCFSSRLVVNACRCVDVYKCIWSLEWWAVMGGVWLVCVCISVCIAFYKSNGAWILIIGRLMRFVMLINYTQCHC